MQKGFSHRPGERVLTWLFQCWGNGASSFNLVAAKPGSWDLLLWKGTLTKQLEKGRGPSAYGSSNC